MPVSLRGYKRSWLVTDLVAGAIPETIGYTSIAQTSIVKGQYTGRIPANKATVEDSGANTLDDTPIGVSARVLAFVGGRNAGQGPLRQPYPVLVWHSGVGTGLVGGARVLRVKGLDFD